MTDNGTAKETRILLADDHELVRRGLRGLLESQPGYVVCGEAASGREALEKTKELDPDVVLMDIAMPDMSGLEATREIVSSMPRVKVLILTMHDSEHLIRDVLKAGAQGYLLKSDPGHEILASISATERRRPYLSSGVGRALVNGYASQVSSERPYSASSRGELTAREREVVQRFASGKTTREVAASLKISIKTVESHRSNIMRKLGVYSMGEVVRYAVRNDIVPPVMSEEAGGSSEID